MHRPGKGAAEMEVEAKEVAAREAATGVEVTAEARVAGAMEAEATAAGKAAVATAAVVMEEVATVGGIGNENDENRGDAALGHLCGVAFGSPLSCLYKGYCQAPRRGALSAFSTW